MPPKPWETRKANTSSNISQIIQSNPTIKQQIIKQPALVEGAANNPALLDQKARNAAATTTAYSATNPYGSYGAYGGMSSYGGYGGMSSYGGYGGLGGLGGLGGYGRYGMMGGAEGQKGFLSNTLITLESFGYLINILCQIARSLDTNAQGLHLFYNSFKKLVEKIKDSIKGGAHWVYSKVVNFFYSIYTFIKENIFFLNKKEKKDRYRALSIITKIVVAVLAISLYPIVRKAIKN